MEIWKRNSDSFHFSELNMSQPIIICHVSVETNNFNEFRMSFTKYSDLSDNYDFYWKIHATILIRVESFFFWVSGAKKMLIDAKT